MMLKIFKQNPLLLLIFLPFFVLVYLGALTTATYYYENRSDLGASTVFFDHYEKEVAQSTDPYKAGRLGMVFLKTNYSDLALAAFSRSASLDAKWRDAWLWKAYTELALKKPQDALTSLMNAEKLDPTYAFTYQLLAKTYLKLGNTAEAKTAQEKLNALAKK